MLDGFEYQTPESLTISAHLAGIESRGLAALVVVASVAYYVIAEPTSAGRSVGKANFGLRVL